MQKEDKASTDRTQPRHGQMRKDAGQRLAAGLACRDERGVLVCVCVWVCFACRLCYVLIRTVFGLGPAEI